MSKRFLNSNSSFVEEAIDGFVMASQGRVTRLDGYPDVKVVVRSDVSSFKTSGKVALISGGGSGHEPAHAGFVGEGLLTAAVCGELFASPSVSAVLAAIVAVTGEAGCLLIIKNYTEDKRWCSVPVGDRLNFGLASEIAKSKYGLKVEMVVVGDDVALPDNPQPRGVAGTCFLHKVLGGAAEEGMKLAELSSLGSLVSSQISSLGMSLSVCHKPGDFDASTEARLAPQETEVGLGIHGEPGAHKRALGSAKEMMEEVVKMLLREADARGKGVGKGPVALLLNNLGNVPESEMAVLTHEVLLSMRKNGVEVGIFVGPARMMTALDMNGFSISVLPVDSQRTKWLSSPVPSPSWPGAGPPAPFISSPMPSLQSLESSPPSEDPEVRMRLTAAVEAILTAEGELNKLDGVVGDGDCGTTLANGARKVKQELEKGSLPLASPADLALRLGELSAALGGSSGVLASIFFNAAADALKSGKLWREAAVFGAQAMSKYGGAVKGSRTSLDALLPFVEVYQASSDLAAAALAAEKGADSTKGMLKATHGRSAYVRGDALEGHPDPGAVAVSKLVRALATQGAKM